MVILRPKRWSQSPPHSVQLNRHLPAGVLGVWLFNEGVPGVIRNLATEGWEITSGTIAVGVTARGPAYKHNGTDARANLLDADDCNTLLPTGGGLTVCLGYEKQDATLRASGAFGIGSIFNEVRCGALIPFSDGVVYWDFGGFTEDVTRESIGGLTTSGYHPWAFTTGPRGMEIWQDGIRKSANSANPTRSAQAQAWQLGTSVTVGSDLANYYWFFAHRFQLPPDLVREICLAPFGVLVEPQAPRRTFIIPGSGGGAATGHGTLVGAQRLARSVARLGTTLAHGA